MKRFSNIFALAIVCASALSFAACTKVDPEGSKESEISFMVANYATTKADSDADDHIELSNSFGVYCYFTPGQWASTNSEKVLYMDNQQVQKVDSQWKTVGQTYKWPRAGKLSFVGFTPYATEGQEKFNVAVTNGNLALTLADYTVKTDGTQPDIMYSDATLNKSENDNATHYVEGVPMLFHHALTKVNVQVKCGEIPSGAKLYLKSIKFADINTKGDFNSSASPKWSNPSEEAEYDFGPAADTEITSTWKTDFPSYIVMPQTLAADGQMLEIAAYLSFTVQGHAARVPLNVSIPIRTDAVSAWLPGQEIIYKITLSESMALIQFEGQKTDWTETANTDIKI